MPVIIRLPNDIWAFFIFLGVLFAVVGLADFLAKKLKIRPEDSRKIAHILVGLFVSVSPFIFHSPHLVLVLGILFIIINWLALKRDTFRGMHGTERLSNGTVLFPLAFVILVMLYWYANPALLITAMLVLALADPLAALAGERLANPHNYTLWREKKSFEGSLTFFVMSFLIIVFIYPPLVHLSQTHPPLPNMVLWPIAAITALAATLAEALSNRGSDNLSLTLVTAFMMDIAMNAYATGHLIELTGWTAFLSALVYGAYRLKTLDASGASGAFLLGVFLAGIAGWQALLPLLTFFILSSFLSKLADYLLGKDETAEKGSRRDVLQVLANGGPALVFMLMEFFTKQPIYYGAFLAALAAAAADTWETEGGRFSSKHPRNILTWKKIPRGTSGGVSIIGSLIGIIGSVSVVLAGIRFLHAGSISQQQLFWMIVIFGFAGSLVDSLLGAGVQCQFECQVCGKQTEKEIHCHQPTRFIGGWRKLNNDGVNFIGTASAGLLWLLAVHFFKLF